ncbi:hypothetical protein TNCV_2115021 [Trichonephila clavipes]|nr:hypothetical protein TNCV_2115021 [Trichonephila clavipes]
MNCWPLWVPSLNDCRIDTIETTIMILLFYQELRGGMKAVLWADVFQVVLMFAALFAIIIKGFMFLGSIGDIFDIANEGGRLVIPRFTLDPEAPYSMISVFAQGMILIMSSYGGSQNQVQRFRTLKNLNKSKL